MSEEKKRRKIKIKDMERMNVPSLHWKTKVKHVPASVNGEVQSLLKKIDIVVEKGIGLLITGATGVGKTAIATLMLKEARAAGHTGYFTTTWELRDAMRQNKRFDGEMPIMQRCRTVTVLVLDDLTEEDFDIKFMLTIQDINALVKHRASKNLITILTSKIPDKQQTMGFHRIHAGHLVNLDVTGPDLWRKRNQSLRSELFSPDE